MKTLILKTVFFVSIITLTSCVAEKTIVIANGKHITERQFERRLKKAHRRTMRQMSKEDRKIIKDTRFSVETSEQ